MESTELAIRLIILFVPGIIETFIYEISQNKKDINDRDFYINVALSAFVTYSFTYFIMKLMGRKSTFLDALLDSSVKIDMLEILMASVLAVVMGFLESRLIKKMVEFTKNKNEKNKKVRVSVWDNLFEENDVHVRIILKEQEIIYEGYITRYSASSTDKKELYLKDVTKYDFKTGNQLQCNISGTYLQIREDEDVIMEIL